MKHATTRLDGYVIPLIGIPVSATEQKCSRCGQTRHIQDIKLDEECNPICKDSGPECRNLVPLKAHRSG